MKMSHMDRLRQMAREARTEHALGMTIPLCSKVDVSPGATINHVCEMQTLTDGRQVWFCHDPNSPGLCGSGDTEEEALAAFNENKAFFKGYLENQQR
jgi:hypothetical protein